jgi:hypothetical protein
MTRLRLGVVLLAATAAPAALCDEPPSPPTVHKVLGDVTALDSSARRMTVRSDTGEEAQVSVDPASTCLKVPPGAKALSEGTPIDCATLVVGDRIFVRGTALSADQALVARQIVVMTKDDLDEKRAAERAEWRRRGSGGVVAAVDPATHEIKLEIRSIAGMRELIVVPAGEATTYHRYAPGSARFADAKSCTFGDIRVGDQLRALGERSGDGERFLAEQIVAGAFRTLVGEVESVRGDARELILGNVVSARGNGAGSAERRTVTLDASARLRRLPPEMAARLAAPRAGGPNAAGGRPGGGRGTWRPPTGSGESGARPRRSSRGGGPPTLGEMLDRFPEVTLADLKPGELVAVAVAEDSGKPEAQLQASVLLAGIEPLLAAGGSPRQNGGLQTGLAAGALDLGMGMGE